MTETTHSLHRRATLMLLLTTVLWGVSFPVIKSIILLNGALMPGAGPWLLTALALAPRFTLAAALMLLIRRRGAGLPSRLEARQGLGLGLFAIGGTLFQTDGMQYTSASTSAFLTQVYAVLIPLWFALRGRRGPGPALWVGCLLVLCGVAILGRFDWRTLHLGRGEWETLVSSVFFMGQILWLERREFAGNRPGSVTLTMFAVQAAFFLAFAWMNAPEPGALAALVRSPAWIGLTVILTLVCTIGAFWLMNVWQPYVPATQAGLIYCLEPVLASLFALVLPGVFSGWAGIHYPNERATGSLVVGGGLIMVANILVQATFTLPKDSTLNLPAKE